MKIAEILYFLGAGIIATGTFVLFLQNWNQFGIITSLAIFLGLGIATFVTGVILENYKKYKSLKNIFYALSAFILPIGLNVLYHSIGLDILSKAVQIQIYGILFVFYFLAYLTFKNIRFVIFDIIFGTLFFYFFILYIFVILKIETYRNHLYLTLLLSLLYLLLGYLFNKLKFSDISKYLYNIGISGIIFSTCLLGGWKNSFFRGYSILWQILFPIICLAIIVLGKYLKQTYFFVISIIAIMIFIFKISMEHFGKMYSWPIAMIISGFGIITVGTLVYKLNQKNKKRRK